MFGTVSVSFGSERNRSKENIFGSASDLFGSARILGGKTLFGSESDPHVSVRTRKVLFVGDVAKGAFGIRSVPFGSAFGSVSGPNGCHRTCASVRIRSSTKSTGRSRAAPSGSDRSPHGSPLGPSKISDPFGPASDPNKNHPNGSSGTPLDIERIRSDPSRNRSDPNGSEHPMVSCRFTMVSPTMQLTFQAEILKYCKYCKYYLKL